MFCENLNCTTVFLLGIVMSGIKTVTVTVTSNEIENNVWKLNRSIDMKGGYIVTLQNTTASAGFVQLYTGQIVDGNDFTIKCNDQNGGRVLNSLHPSTSDGASITLRGQWKLNFGQYIMEGSELSIREYEDVTYTIQNAISNSSGVLYSALKNGNHIKDSVINMNCALSSYAVVERTDGVLTKYEIVDFPEFVIMDRLTFENLNARLTVNKGSVVLTEGEYMNSSGQLLVSGWKNTIECTVSSTSKEIIITSNVAADSHSNIYIPSQVVEGTYDPSEKTIILKFVNSAQYLVGNPFLFKYKYRNTEYNINEVSIGGVYTCLYGDWVIEDQHTAYYKKGENTITLTATSVSDSGLRAFFDNRNKIVPNYECITNGYEVTLNRENFVVDYNMTFQNVEYDDHVYVNRPLTYKFDNLKVNSGKTLNVLESSIVVEGNLEVEEGATVKCKNLIIN